jgi:hypothetical protein
MPLIGEERKQWISRDISCAVQVLLLTEMCEIMKDNIDYFMQSIYIDNTTVT